MRRNLFLFFTLLIFNSCLDNEIEFQIRDTGEIALAKNWIEQSTLDFKNRMGGRQIALDINWDEAIFYQKKNIEIVEVPVHRNGKGVSIGSNQSNNLISKVLIFKRGSKYEAAVMDIIPVTETFEFSNEFLENLTLKDLSKKYSGLLNFYDIHTNDLISGYLIKEGLVIKKLNKSSKTGSNNRLDCYSITTTYWTCSAYGCNEDYQTYYEYCYYTPDQNVYDQSLEPTDPLAGGGGGGENSLIELDQTIGQLCNNLIFSHVGNSFTAEVTGLGLTAINHLLNKAIHAEIGICCIQIPDYYLSNGIEASTVFTNAFNSARQQIGNLLNSGLLAPKVSIR